MATNMKIITKKYALEADRKNLHFSIPTAGEIAFLFLSSKTGQHVLSEFNNFPISCTDIEDVEATLDSLITDTLLLSATLSGMPIFGLEDTAEQEARIDEWKQEIPETIEICHRALIEYIETENMQ